MRNNRSKALIKANRENTSAISRGFPKSKSIVVGSKIIHVQLQFPVYKNKAELLGQDNNLPFVELLEPYTDWLYNFSGQILDNSKSESKFTFFNSSLDYKNPGISAFRIYDNDLDYLQVQARKIPEYPTMYQLDYFEKEHSQFVPKMVLIVDVSDPKETMTDIVMAKCSSEKSAEYACRIASTFRDILVYMRPWCYDSLELKAESKECIICPLFDLNSTTWNILDCPDLPELPRI